jgi:hypothetical protein
MKNEFANYEQSLALKELGFDEEVFQRFTLPDMDEFCKHPLKQQVFRWFRDKHNLFGCIDLQCCEPAHWFFRIDDIIKNDYLYHSEDENLRLESFEEAEDACIDKLIEIVKQK